MGHRLTVFWGVIVSETFFTGNLIWTFEPVYMFPFPSDPVTASGQQISIMFALRKSKPSSNWKLRPCLENLWSNQQNSYLLKKKPVRRLWDAMSNCRMCKFLFLRRRRMSCCWSWKPQASIQLTGRCRKGCWGLCCLVGCPISQVIVLQPRHGLMASCIFLCMLVAWCFGLIWYC